jgi:hypothetical protein
VERVASVESRIGVYSLFGLSTLILAVGLFVSGIVLVVTCVPFVSPPPTTTVIDCSYPFQWYGAVFFLAAALSSVLAGALFTREREIQRGQDQPDRREYVRLLFVGAVAVLIYTLVALTLGLF